MVACGSGIYLQTAEETVGKWMSISGFVMGYQTSVLLRCSVVWTELDTLCVTYCY